MKQKGLVISEVILYTICGKPLKVCLTSAAKKQLITLMESAATYNGFKDVEGSLNILDKSGKVVRSLPYKELRPFIREL